MQGILEQLRILHKPEDIIEIRSPKPKPAYSGYFRADDPNIEKAIQSLKGRNIYQTMNLLKDGIDSRTSFGRLNVSDTTTSDTDIKMLKWVLIDCDPVRPAEISSSDAEKERAKATCGRVYKYLKKLGFSEPVVADSGNGYHLLYRISMEPNKKDIIRKFLQTLDKYFSDDDVQIDTAVFNPARITKLYGTMACKGRSTAERPHRLSGILRAPEEIKATSSQLLEAVIDESGRAQASVKTDKEFDIVRFMERNGLRYREQAWHEGRKYVLEECPFDSGHRAPDSAIFVGNDGRLGFKCLHNSCSCYGWHELREKFEPGCYDATSAYMPASTSYTSGFNRIQAEAEPVPMPSGDRMLDITEVDDYDASKVEYITSGFQKLDSLMGGFSKGEMTIWSGSNGAGKSTIVSQMALEAISQKKKVALFSGELTPTRVKYWLYLQAAGRSGVEQDGSHWKLKKGVKERINEMLKGSFAVYNNDFGCNVETVVQAVMEWVKANGAEVVIIDNLMSLDASGGESKYDMQGAIVKRLSLEAKRMNVHIHFICHPKKTKDFLRKEDVSGSADLTNAADNVLMIHRVTDDLRKRLKEYFPKLKLSEDANNLLEIMKNRSEGVTETFIELYYDATCKTFSDVKGGRPRFETYEMIENNDEELPF